MTDRDAFDPAGPRFWDLVVTPLLRQVWAVALVATFGILAVAAFSRLQVPRFEATAVVQAGPSVDVAGLAERLLSRGALADLARRQGLAQDEASLVRLRTGLALTALQTRAGRGLGQADVPGGVVVSVMWGDPEQAARLANDLAQQILDRPDAGLDAALQSDLAFFRRDEARLWQEIAALQAEVEALGRDPGAVGRLAQAQRTLGLLSDQYQVVRRELAEDEVAARREQAENAGKFSLLQRARATEAQPVGAGWLLAGVAGSLLLGVAAAFVLERRFPGLSRPHYAGPPPPDTWHGRLYRVFDDPARPILGLPRFVVVSALIVGWLTALTLVLGAPG